MPSAIADSVHMANTFARAGLLKPSRPDRTLRALVGLHRFGPTLAAGYLGAAARYPDTPAIFDDLGTLSFAELDRAGNAIARGLAGYGVAPGDGVAIMCRNHRWFVAASIACSRLGAHALYLNTSFAAPQVTEVCDREGPAAVGLRRGVRAGGGRRGAQSSRLPGLDQPSGHHAGGPSPSPPSRRWPPSPPSAPPTRCPRRGSPAAR